MKPIEHAFLADILESPDDDFPRRVYADWLEENDQPERAEFIRVQCSIEEMQPLAAYFFIGFEPERIEFDALRRREGELLASGRFDWETDLAFAVLTMGGEEPPFTLDRIPWASCAFRRGFVEEVTLSLADWLRHGPAMVRAAPLRAVRISDYQPGFNERWGWAYVPGRAELGAGNWWRVFRDALLKRFVTEDDALAAMSRCCLEYARDQNTKIVPP